MYDYCIVDCQYFLARNYFAILSNFDKLPDNGWAMIATSVIRSLIKLRDSLEFRKMILVWDTYPYIKHQLLQGDYKSGRSYTTDEDVEECEDPEEKARLEIDAFNLKQRGQAKWLLKDLSKFGLPSFYKKGYEADDLAYIISNRVKELGHSAVIVSIDSDWNYWINENVDWYSPKRGLKTYKETLAELGLPHDLSLFEYKRLYDSFYGSHNDYYQTVTDENWNMSFLNFYELFKNSKNKESLFKDYNLFVNQYNALDVLNYEEHNKVQSMLYYMDKSGGIPSKGMWESFRTKNCLSVTSACRR